MFVSNSAADERSATSSADDEVTGEILDIVAKETGVARGRMIPDATIVSLEIASLDMVQAIFALESRFDVEIPVMGSQGSDDFGTVGMFVQHVKAAIDAKAAA